MAQEIDMTKPQPYDMFDVADAEAWGMELSKGVYEVIKEVAYIEQFFDCVDRDDEARLAEKLTNVIHTCVSWIHVLGYDEKQRGDLHRMVNEKNKKRGYF